ncbi:MAG: hypothetical protein RJA61_507 [Candidatus Parcubacteria bacterium]|jgi:small subunit ribosomal protein S20
MPIIRSAKKALRASARKRVYNLRRKDAVVGSLKTVKKLVEEKKKDEARKALSLAYKALDKAVKTGLLKANTASRKKSRLSRVVKNIK